VEHIGALLRVAADRNFSRFAFATLACIQIKLALLQPTSSATPCISEFVINH
jgi:hypothetical protein